MRNARFRCSIILAGMLVAGATQAQRTAPPPQRPSHGAWSVGDSDVPTFESLDKDHHGYLKRSDLPKDVESLKELRVHFMDADRDGNGRLSPEEYAAYFYQSPGRP